MGGNVALNFGLTHPDMAASLIVAGTGTGSTDAEAFRQNVNRLADLMEERERADGNVETEMISEEDRTVGSDGRLK